MPAAELLPKNPTETYLIIFLALFISEKIVAMAIRGAQALRNKNGKSNGKDETKLMPCLDSLLINPLWESHKIETHDTRESSKRMEASLSILKRESLLQTSEIKKQTKAIESSNKLLAKIAKNGSQ